MKNHLFFVLAFVLSSALFARDFGVYIGADRETILAVLDAKSEKTLAVLDSEESSLSADDISHLHKNAHEIFSYINVGSLETWRTYFDDFSHLTLAPYEHWQDEFWVDVSQKEWQEHILKIAETCVSKGVDGFFLDNFDVYTEFRSDDIFYGLTTIITALQKYGKKIIINSGDVFVDFLIRNGMQDFLYGICQESVFTRVQNYRTERFAKQKSTITSERLGYLLRARSAGLHVFAVEYAKTPSLAEYARVSCEKNAVEYYIAPSLSLDARDEW